MRGPATPLSFLVPEEAAGMRLDAVLGILYPKHGIRARRRLWEWCRITVNGRAAKPGAIPRVGDIINIVPNFTSEAAAASSLLQNFQACGVSLEALSAELAVLCKPAGLHSAALAGGREISLESLLPDLWSGLVQRFNEVHGSVAGTLPPVPQLLTRLDRETSGLLLGAFSAEAAERFRQAEKDGKATKNYLAVLSGRLAEPLFVDRALDTADRVRTRVCAQSDPDPVRSTSAVPLCFTEPLQDGSSRFAACSSGSLTIARVTIQRGARHQIRAHLASAGFPLFGDTLYSPGDIPCSPAPAAFFLHHTELCLPELRVRVLPEWAPEGLEETAG